MSTGDGTPAAESREGVEAEASALAGERGIPSVNRVRSMQSRVTSLLAIAFVTVMGIGFLAWYYSHEWKSRQAARERAAQTTQQRAQGEMKLPPLGRVEPPRVKAMPASEPAPVPKGSGDSVWGRPPPLPPAPSGPAVPMAYRPQPASTTAPAPVDRRLTGPVFSDDAASNAGGASGGAVTPTVHADSMALSEPTPSPASGGSGPLAALLRPTPTPATAAGVLPTQRLLLPKGSFVDCTLETAIDSSLPGMVTCVTPTDIFSADGMTVLLERGTKLTGETRGEARQGLKRVFVLWTEARTPSGIVAALESPGTDELGRAGLPGHVQRHFFERFSAAILVSVIEGAIQRAARPEGGGTVILNPTASTSVATEVLKSTVNIPPTILKHHGERIQILVARDVDFRSVYELRPATSR
jgi:type IV secretion system protein VirB10